MNRCLDCILKLGTTYILKYSLDVLSGLRTETLSLHEVFRKFKWECTWQRKSVNVFSKLFLNVSLFLIDWVKEWMNDKTLQFVITVDSWATQGGPTPWTVKNSPYSFIVTPLYSQFHIHQFKQPQIMCTVVHIYWRKSPCTYGPSSSNPYDSRNNCTSTCSPRFRVWPVGPEPKPRISISPFCLGGAKSW